MIYSAINMIPSLVLNNNCFNSIISIFPSCDPDYTFEQLYWIWKLSIIKWNFRIFCALNLKITILYLKFVPNVNMKYSKSITIWYIIKTVTCYAWNFVILKTKHSTNFLFMAWKFFKSKSMIKIAIYSIIH